MPLQLAEVSKDKRDHEGRNTGTGNISQPVVNNDKSLCDTDAKSIVSGKGTGNSVDINVLGNNVLEESSKMKNQVVKSGKTKTYREIDRVEDSLFVKLLDFLEELVEDGVYTKPIPYHPLELKERLSKEIESQYGKYNFIIGDDICPGQYMEAFSFIYRVRVLVDNSIYKRLYEVNQRELSRIEASTVHLIVKFAYCEGDTLKVKRCKPNLCYRKACLDL